MQAIVQKLISLFFRLLLVALGLVFAALLLAAGLLFTLVLLVWSLARGRRPRLVKFRVDPRFGFAPGRQAAAASAEVVDVEAREVPDAPQPLTHDKR